MREEYDEKGIEKRSKADVEMKESKGQMVGIRQI